jgi:hypothetical protein
MLEHPASTAMMAVIMRLFICISPKRLSP